MECCGRKNIHHFRVSMTAGFLLLAPRARRISDSAPFQVMKSKTLLGSDSFVGKCQCDEALPSCIETGFPEWPAVAGNDDVPS